MSQTDCHKATFVRIIFLYLESAVTTFLAYFISCLYIAGSHQMLRTGTSWHLQLLHFKARLALTFLKCVAIHILLISCLEFFISGRNCGEVFKGVQGVLDCQKTPDLDKSQWTVQTSAWGNENFPDSVLLEVECLVKSSYSFYSRTSLPTLISSLLWCLFQSLAPLAMWQLNNDSYARSADWKLFQMSCEPHWSNSVPPPS